MKKTVNLNCSRPFVKFYYKKAGKVVSKQYFITKNRTLEQAEEEFEQFKQNGYKN